MPKISTDKVYGNAANDGNLLFRERLEKRFAAHDWVRVINISDDVFQWQYLPVHSEYIHSTPDGMQRIVTRDPVEAYALEPGESEVLLGENAYVMIEKLYKELITKKFLSSRGEPKLGDTGRKFNWSDPLAQEEIINRVFLGKENPTFGTPKVTLPEVESLPSEPAKPKATQLPSQPASVRKAPTRLRKTA